MAKSTYDSKAIEVLSGLDPVKKRPGMYTDTSCPNHLIQEVLDNCQETIMTLAQLLAQIEDLRIKNKDCPPEVFEHAKSMI